MAGNPPTGLFVGLTTLDVVHRAVRRPGPDEKVTATQQDVAAGGPAANAAVTFAALGGRARLLSALGPAPAGQLARRELEDCGVEVVDATADRGFALAVSAAVVEEGTGRRSVVSPDAGRHPVPAPGALVEALAVPDVVLVDGHHPALAAAVLGRLAARAPVVLDAGRWKPQMAELLPQVSHAVLSADFRVPDGPDPGADLSLPGHVRALGPDVAVITHGADPVEWQDGTGHGAVAVPAVPARDTLGAGDAFHGAFAAALTRASDTPSAVALAIAVAAERVQVAGPRSWLSRLEPWW